MHNGGILSIMSAYKHVITAIPTNEPIREKAFACMNPSVDINENISTNLLYLRVHFNDIACVIEKRGHDDVNNTD